MRKKRRETNCFQKKECFHKEIQSNNMMKYPSTQILNPLIRFKGKIHIDLQVLIIPFLEQGGWGYKPLSYFYVSLQMITWMCQLGGERGKTSPPPHKAQRKRQELLKKLTIGWCNLVFVYFIISKISVFRKENYQSEKTTNHLVNKMPNQQS